jgi:putative membrane protein
MSTLFAFLHHLAAFTLVGALAVEFVLVGMIERGAALSPASARRLAVADAVLGAAAGILLVVGLLRVFFFEKGADYYFHNPAFLTKFSLFILVALLSIIPTREFLAWRRALRAGQAAELDARRLSRVRLIIHGELGAVVVILLCAAIMARGGWI